MYSLGNDTILRHSKTVRQTSQCNTVIFSATLEACSSSFGVFRASSFMALIGARFVYSGFVSRDFLLVWYITTDPARWQTNLRDYTYVRKVNQTIRLWWCKNIIMARTERIVRKIGCNYNLWYMTFPAGFSATGRRWMIVWKRIGLDLADRRLHPCKHASAMC